MINFAKKVMDIISFLSSRYSVRSYDNNRPIEKDKLMRVLEAGRFAPSASNRQPWRIMVIQSPSILNQLSACYQTPWFANCNTVLVVKGTVSEAWSRKSDGYNSIETDLTILMDHLILAAHAEGLGTCWIANFDPELLKKTLKLTSNEVVFAFTPIGYPVEGEQAVRPKTRKSLDEIVEWVFDTDSENGKA